MRRKNYMPLPDTALDKLKSESSLLLGHQHANVILTASALHALVSEVIDSRDEIFRLQLCETVDQIINEELEGEPFAEDGDDEDFLTFAWPPRSGSDRVETARSSAETERLPSYDPPTDPLGLDSDPSDTSGRLPRID